MTLMSLTRSRQHVLVGDDEIRRVRAVVVELHKFDHTYDALHTILCTAVDDKYTVSDTVWLRYFSYLGGSCSGPRSVSSPPL